MLSCFLCAATFAEDEPRWRCDCGAYLLLDSDGMFRREVLGSRPATLWRYREALGVAESSAPVTLGEGMTPLIEADFGRHHGFLKLDFLCPTGSYKDRGSSVMLTKLKQWGLKHIIEDSSGNAGASIAAYAALARIETDIYIPDSTSAGKAAQISMYGANLVKVPGSREDTARAALNAAEDTFYASHNWSPHFVAGMKTAAYELSEQMGWTVPDWVLAPAGGGGLVSGLYAGFADLLAAGITNHMPRIAVVQAAACDPIYRAWRADADDVAGITKGETVAEGISVAKPVRGRAILSAIRQSNGIVTTVSDDEVWDALHQLGSLGVYVEPTAAAAPAAFRRLRDNGTIPANATVAVMLTGSGLKATDKIVRHFDTEVVATV